MSSISKIVVNGAEYKIDYRGLDNLPDLSNLEGFEECVKADDVEGSLKSDSDNPVSSRAVYNALQQLELEGANITVDSSIEDGSLNPVCGGAVYTAIEGVYDQIDASVNQLSSSINNQAQTISNKVDKVEGKGLSSNDFTNTYKNILNRTSEGLLKKPTVADEGQIPYIHNGIWTYVTVNDMFDFAESESF